MATQKLKQITAPVQPARDMTEVNKDIQKATELIRKKTRNEGTRARRKSKIDDLIDTRNNGIDVTLEPLLDKIFAYLVEHWEELAPSSSPETVPLNDVDFKRTMDSRGTKEVDEKTVIAYIENIDNSEMIRTLRKILGADIVDELVDQLSKMVTSETIKKLDSDALKDLVKKRPELEIPGFAVVFHNKVTMALHQSATEKRAKKSPPTETRAWPAS